MGMLFGHKSSCTKQIRSAAVPRKPFPKFGKFKIERVYENQNGWLVAQVTYPDAGGRKIMLYNATYAELYAAKFLDPHFCDDKSHLSPFARFEPTDDGWTAAVQLCTLMKESR
jgi:hypothetical protein